MSYHYPITGTSGEPPTSIYGTLTTPYSKHSTPPDTFQLLIINMNELQIQKPQLPLEALDIIASYSPDFPCVMDTRAALRKVFDTTVKQVAWTKPSGEPLKRPPADPLALYRGHEVELLNRGLENWEALSRSDLTFRPTIRSIEEILTTGIKDLKYFEPITDISCLQPFFMGLSKEQLTIVITFLKTHCPKLQTLDLFRSKVTSTHLQQLSGFKDIKVLNLSYTAVVDEDLMALRQMAIEELNLAGTHITGSCFKWLGENLTALNLCFCKQLDVTKLYLLQESRLQRLDLSLTSVTDRAFDLPEDIAGLSTDAAATWLPQSLVELILTMCPVTDAVIPKLTETAIRILNLSYNNNITGEYFDQLPKQLRVLKISGCVHLVARHLQKLANTQIEELNASHTEIPDSGVEQLPKGLKKLDLTWNSKITGTKFCTPLQELEELLLSFTFVDNGINNLHNPKLTKLAISSCYLITQLNTLPPSLKELSAPYCTGLSDDGLTGLAALQLDKLDLTGTRINGQVLQYVNTQELILKECRELTDKALGTFKSEQLQRLDLSNTLITEKGLNSENFPKLRELKLFSCLKLDYRNASVLKFIAQQCAVFPTSILLSSVYTDGFGLLNFVAEDS